MFKFKKDEQGSSVVSYGLVVGLIAVALIASLSGTGENISSLFNSVNQQLAGAASGGVSPLTDEDYGTCEDYSLTEEAVVVLNDWAGQDKNVAEWCETTQILITGDDVGLIPAEIGALKQLTGLFLYSVNVQSVPSSLGNLTNLQSLDLEGNPIGSVPAGLQSLTSLRSLGLNGTGISSVPSWIGDLSNLTSLRVSGNNLTDLPETVTNLSNLDQLYVSENAIVSLSSSICDFGATLEVFYFDTGVCPGSGEGESYFGEE